MTAEGEPSRNRGGAFAAALALAGLALSACAANSYAGIPLTASAADPELQSLAGRAQAGDKQAQLELGIRFEEGRGVPVDRARARRLYRKAARTTRDTRIAHVPAGPGGRAQTVAISGGSVVPGLPEAAQRLADLESGESSPAGVSPAYAPSEAPGGIDEAFRDLVQLDRRFAGCMPSAGQQPDRTQRFLAARACVRAGGQRPGCDDLRSSSRKAARLILANDAFAVLAPAAARALRDCKGAAGTAVGTGGLSPVDLLGASPQTRLEQIDTPAATYLQELCVATLTGALLDIRSSEILICSASPPGEGAIGRYRESLRAILNGSF